MLKRLRADYIGVRSIWGKYWAAYGGCTALFSSTYLYVALALTVINFGAWYHSGWWDVVIASVPTILGFTLAGLAVFLGMDSGFSKMLAGKGKSDVSPFMALVSAFVHFILTQAVAVIVALTVKSAFFQVDGMPDIYYSMVFVLNRIAWFVGYFIYMYSMVQIFSAVFAIFRATRWYEFYVEKCVQDSADRKD
ncbi:hypothetical protein ACTJK3_24915 [Pseudomonas sp. 22105]|jgi:hypothetical protein|uniref:hypothetical protein n=1 Tax=Pseudomonas TaxID=286 RepID=UPI000D259EF9|nr:hypothetical protein [Pseudomonas glycinae]AWA40507.1 hypothetical protein DBV33_18635 [Pseudomonas fluorescens]